MSRNYRKPDDRAVDQFLESIAGVESSYGTNIDHNKDEKYGQAAGNWGLKPAEVQVLPQRLKNRGVEVPESLEKLSKHNFETITSMLNQDKKLDHDTAKALAGVILGDQQENIPRSAYKWHKGVLAPAPEDFDKLTAAEDGYVGKVIKEVGKGDMRNPRFRKLIEQLAGGSSIPATQEEEMESNEAQAQMEKNEYEQDKLKDKRKLMQRLP